MFAKGREFGSKRLSAAAIYGQWGEKGSLSVLGVCDGRQVKGRHETQQETKGMKAAGTVIGHVQHVAGFAQRGLIQE